MMKRKFTKIITLATILTMAFSTSAFAAEPNTVPIEMCTEATDAILVSAQTRSGTWTANISKTYTDQLHVNHYITGTVSCYATAQWDEGASGWIVSAYFYMPNVYIDGNSANVSYVGSTRISGSSAYQTYSINGVLQFTAQIYCDAYGNVSISAN